MCITSPAVSAPPYMGPSMQTANNLSLGGAAGLPRGAADLGRLMLRTSGSGAAASSAGTASQALSSSAQSASTQPPQIPAIAPSASALAGLSLKPASGQGVDPTTQFGPTSATSAQTANPGLQRIGTGLAKV
jgi:hypothetical protein